MKQINLKIKKCNECPYLTFDPDYNISYDCGWDCSRTNRRVVDENECSNPNTRKHWKKDPFKIPEWCPLEDAI